jgi:hypothetical protein
MKINFIILSILITLSGCAANKYKLADNDDDQDFLLEQIDLMYQKEQTSKFPILVVDGAEYVKKSDINLKKLNLKKEDIKEIELLKQEAAIRVFGEQGKRGVLLITTKTG